MARARRRSAAARHRSAPTASRVAAYSSGSAPPRSARLPRSPRSNVAASRNARAAPAPDREIAQRPGRPVPVAPRSWLGVSWRALTNSVTSSLVGTAASAGAMPRRAAASPASRSASRSIPSSAVSLPAKPHDVFAAAEAGAVVAVGDAAAERAGAPDDAPRSGSNCRIAAASSVACPVSPALPHLARLLYLHGASQRRARYTARRSRWTSRSCASRSRRARSTPSCWRSPTCRAGCRASG